MQETYYTPMKENQAIEELEAANTLPENYFWWGSDYEENQDVLVLHSFSDVLVSRRQSAQMFFYKPHYLCRPALQGSVKFLLSRPKNLWLPLLGSENHLTITIRSYSMGSWMDFAVMCDAVNFVPDQPFSQDQFHGPRKVLWVSSDNRGSVTEKNDVLSLIKSTKARWETISSQLSSEVVLAIEGDSSISHIVFCMPFYVDIPKVMTNVSFHPATVQDYKRIQKRLGNREEYIKSYFKDEYNNALRNIVVVECNEGTFFLYTKGVGFKSLV